MKIEIKVLNKEFYKVKRSLGMSYYDLPSYATPDSAAMDLVCTEDVVLYPGETKMIPTGLAIWIGATLMKPQLVLHSQDDGIGSIASYDQLGMEGLILPRSGLGTQGLVLANTIGLIDEDYQGELKVSAWNRNTENPKVTDFLLNGSETVKYFAEGLRSNIELKAGDRFAQLMFIPIIKAQWQVVDGFSNKTIRGDGGFGSTD